MQQGILLVSGLYGNWGSGVVGTVLLHFYSGNAAFSNSAQPDYDDILQMPVSVCICVDVVLQCDD